MKLFNKMKISFTSRSYLKQCMVYMTCSLSMLNPNTVVARLCYDYNFLLSGPCLARTHAHTCICFVYRVVWVLRALWIILSETINMLRKLHKTNIFGMPQKICHMFMYIAPSSGHELFNSNLHFNLIQRKLKVVFWYLGYKECCTFWKIDGNSFKSTNYTVA